MPVPTAPTPAARAASAVGFDPAGLQIDMRVEEHQHVAAGVRRTPVARAADAEADRVGLQQAHVFGAVVQEVAASVGRTVVHHDQLRAGRDGGAELIDGTAQTRPRSASG